MVDQSQPSIKLPRPLAEMVKLVHSTKWSLIKARQELNRSYKEVCIPLLDKCRFLLYEVRPAISIEMEAYKKVNVLYKEPRVSFFALILCICSSICFQVKTLIKKLIKDLKCGRHTSEIQKPEDIVNATIQSQSIERHRSSEDIAKMRKCSSDGKISESKSETDDVNNEIKNGVDKSSAESRIMTDSGKFCQSKNCTDLKTELEEKLNVEKMESQIKMEQSNEEKQKKLEYELALNLILMRVTEKKMRKLCNENLGLISAILDFITGENVCDVDDLRKAMYCQV